MRTTFLLIIFTVIALGCTQQGEDTKIYGNETKVSYTPNISTATASGVHKAVKDNGYTGNASIQKFNSTWYIITLNSGMADQQLNLDQRYKVQQTLTLMKAETFSQNHTVVLNLKSREGTSLATFTQ